MGNSKSAKDVWESTFSRAVEQAAARAILRIFPHLRDEAISQALAQGFLAGVDWCFSERSDDDIADAALAMGVDVDEAMSGAIRKMGGGKDD